MTISIVIPNYNGAHLLKDNLPKVISSGKSFTEEKNTVEIIIVDDASQDNSLEVIRSFALKYKKSHVHIIHLANNKNLGFSSTVNRGVRASSGTIVILLNTDVIPERGFIEKVIPHFDDEKVFAVGFLDKTLEGKKSVLQGRGIGQWKRGLLVHNAGDLSKTYTLWASGGSSAFRKSMWNILGGLNELYNPFYWEDIDLSYRAWKAGYTVVFDKDISVVHEHEKGAIRTHYTTLQFRTIAYRNTLLFVWLNITDVSYLISHILWLPYHSIKTSLVDGNAFLVGLKEALKQLGTIRQMRKQFSKNNKRSDREILSLNNV